MINYPHREFLLFCLGLFVVSIMAVTGIFFSRFFTFIKIKKLINTKISVNVSDKDGKTPLMYACLFGHARVIKLFLKAGVDVSIKDKFGKTALDIAIKNNHTRVVGLLMKHERIVDYSSSIESIFQQSSIEELMSLIKNYHHR